MKRRGVIILSGLFAINILLALYILKTNRPGILEVDFFDVGQGDSIFITTVEGHQILLDGGPDSTVLDRLEEEMPPLDRSIDLVILSHPDYDHLTGLIEVLKRYEVENVLWTGIEKKSDGLAEWNRLLEKEGCNVIIARSDLNISFGLEYIDIVYPFDSLKGEIVEDANNTSIVFKLVYGDTSFLFTGDIFKEIENDILEKGENIESDILKIAHHGSKTSTSESFLSAVNPNAAVISVGSTNTYGHPSPGTLELLEKYGINIFRTDIKGNIKLISDNNKIYGFSNI